MKVPVNRIIPFSAVDGPGNRTAVFLQGCNLDCKYCHNPETRALCIHCGACVGKCPAGALSIVQEPTDTMGAKKSRVVFDPAKCVACDTCIHTCKHDASPRIQWMNADEVLAEIQKQMPFIRGVTVSGGECMLYPEFLTELFAKCKELGLHTLIDSNGMVDFSLYPDLLAVTDGVMLDIKAFREEDHVRVTGSTNETVLQNAAFLAGEDKLYEIRTVVVRELFDPAEVIVSIAEFLRPFTDIGRLRYKLIAFRPFGVREQYQIYESPDASYMQQLRLVALQAGFKDIVII
ncbi:MAG: YjjW family glycine radical enzyme activase [Lachnospiraceae bacterium]|nr:YjjW family glycine radical enzyme activase [Lachnospiraceae bacterium]